MSFLGLWPWGEIVPFGLHCIQGSNYILYTILVDILTYVLFSPQGELCPTSSVQENPYNGSDTNYTIMICISPLILLKMVTLIKLINISSINALMVYSVSLKELIMCPKVVWRCSQNDRLAGQNDMLVGTTLLASMHT